MTSETINNERLMTKAEICAILGISTMTLERRVKDNTIVPVRIGKSVRFTKQSLQQLSKALPKTA